MFTVHLACSPPGQRTLELHGPEMESAYATYSLNLSLFIGPGGHSLSLFPGWL